MNNNITELAEKSQGCPLVYTDFLVQAWRVYDFLMQATKYKKFSDHNLETIVKARWAYILNSLPITEEYYPTRVIALSDSKKEEFGDGYWRHYLIELDNRLHQPYKGNRKVKPTEFTDLIVPIGKEYCETYMSFYSVEGYEADDLAGYVYRNCGKQPNRVKFLHTVDRDWMQLISDSKGFYWVTSRVPSPKERFQNQLADEAELRTFSEVRYKTPINHPEEFVYVKSLFGDDSDNLPPMVPIEYVDLVNPHPIYNIDEVPSMQPIIEDSLNLTPNTSLEHLKCSKECLTKLGLISRTSGTR